MLKATASGQRSLRGDVTDGYLNSRDGTSLSGAFPGVYFVEWNGFIKIGSAQNVEWRRRDIELSIPMGLVTGLAWVPVFSALSDDQPVEHESRIQALFEHVRVRGEWFADVPDLRAYIDQWGYPWPSLEAGSPLVRGWVDPEGGR